jgi:hypothetical protein
MKISVKTIVIMYPSDVGSVRDFCVKDDGRIVNLVFVQLSRKYNSIFFRLVKLCASPCGG